MNFTKLIFIFLILVCLFPFVDALWALVAGILYSFFFNNPYEEATDKATHLLLKGSIIGLGFGMNATDAMQVGIQAAFLMVFSIVFTLTIGYFLGKQFKIERKTAYLISIGTAICGGSAIAAISPLLKVRQNQISLTLGIVFMLNALSLFIFPVVGHFFDLTQAQFGMWAAIAIHDTSSVVGAASQYGDKALEMATTVKLTRALCIVPIALATSYWERSSQRITIPYFIFLFMLAILLNTYFPMPNVRAILVLLSKKGLVVVLFLIGSKLTIAMIKTTGFKVFSYGFTLWCCIAVVSLMIIYWWY